MSDKLWAGRFSKETDRGVNDFNSSIRFDGRMAAEDIEGSMAHAAMLGACGVIEQSEAELIREGLSGILADLESGALSLSPDAEDIHMFVEAELTRRVGDAGKRLHTARSRNDQVALDIRLYLKKEIDAIVRLVLALMRTLVEKAGENLETIMPGYTHLQRAQPVTFAHALMAYAEMLRRDVTRLAGCRARGDESPLGSGALAGTTYPIDRGMTASALGFLRPTRNSMDGVSDRDLCLELSSAIGILMVHLSRFSEEIILWCSHEFRFIELDDAFSTGSSIMPQKKNPDVAELVRGKTGRVIGDMTALFTMMKGLPLAYNKDMQEDKEAIFDAVDTVKLCLSTFTGMVSTMTVKPGKMRDAAAGGFINATDCADYLVRKGLPFRDAYKITGRLVALCIERSATLESLPIDAYKEASALFGADVYDAIKLENCVERRQSEGGPSRAAVEKHIAETREFLAACSPAGMPADTEK